MPEDLPLPDEPEIEPLPIEPVLHEPAPAEPATEPATEPAPTDIAPTEPAAVAIAELPPAACAARLAELFPALFTPGAAKPLKLRIQADIQLRAPSIFTKKSLSIFLHRHTTSTAYLRALVASPQRVDLDGEPAGDVADEHRAAAATELERRRALHDERRAAEREAQRKMHEAQRQAEPSLRQPPGANRPPHDAQPRPPGMATDGPRRPARPPRHAQGDARRPPDPRPRNHAEQRPPRDPQGAPHAVPVQRADAGHVMPTADDEGRRERALLLRAYESTTLTRANFCVLKRMTEAQLEDVLAQARLDAPRREAPAPRPAAPGTRPAAEAPPPRRGPRR